MYRDIPEELRILIEPIVADAGFELVDVRLARGGRPWNLRVTIDNESGDGRIPIDSCAEVSREIASQLDVAGSIDAAYTLEVSSPGLDRILARTKDFSAACGCEVQIETKRPVDGRKRFRGVLEAFEEEVAVVNVDGGRTRIAFDEIAKARKIYKFTKADFAGKAG